MNSGLGIEFIGTELSNNKVENEDLIVQFMIQIVTTGLRINNAAGLSNGIIKEEKKHGI